MKSFAELSQTLVPMPASLFARLDEAVRTSETTQNNFIAVVLRRYVDKPQPGVMPVLPPLLPPANNVAVFLPTALLADAQTAYAPATAPDSILAALYHHFDQLDRGHAVQITEIVLPQKTYQQLEKAAVQLNCTIDALLCRICGDYFYDPEVASLSIDIPACDSPHIKTYTLGQSITKQFIGAAGRHRAQGQPEDMRLILARAVQRFVDARPPQPERPIVTPHSRALSKKLRL